MVYNNIPVFAVNVDDPGCSISTMSLVDDPAMSIDMVCFRVDFPIIRLTEDGDPYYIVFNK